MEALAPILHAFYESNLSPSDRTALHSQILSSMKDEACVHAADEYIQRCTSALVESTNARAPASHPANGALQLPPTTPTPSYHHHTRPLQQQQEQLQELKQHTLDPLLLHYALHALETRARTMFHRTDPALRSRITLHAVDLLVAVFGWNRALAAFQADSHRASDPCSLESPTTVIAVGATSSPTVTGEGGGGGGRGCVPSLMSGSYPSGTQTLVPVPSHIIAKAARVVVEMGKREWVLDPHSKIPSSILALIDQNGHSPESPSRIFAGMSLITILVDDALDSSRFDLLQLHRALLRKRVASIATKVVEALEVGIRISGPGLPIDIPCSAVKTLGSLARVAHGVAGECVQVLRRSVMNRYDLVSCEVLTVLSELYGESKIPLPDPWTNVLAHLSGLLEPVAMRDAAVGNSDGLTLYRKKLANYAESVLSRCMTEYNSNVFERALNGLMGCTMRWAEEAPPAFGDALNAWMTLLDTVEESAMRPSNLFYTAYSVIAKLCLQRCMFISNAKVLRALEVVDEEDDLDDDENDAMIKTAAFNQADVIAEIGSSPTAYSSMVFITSGFHGHSGTSIEESTVGADDAFGTRKAYLSSCVDALTCSARLLGEPFATQVVDFLCKVLGEQRQADGQTVGEWLEDRRTAARIAYSVVPLIPAGGTSLLMLSRVVLSALSSNVTGEMDNELEVLLFRSAVCLVPNFGLDAWPDRSDLSRNLAIAARRVLGKHEKRLSRRAPTSTAAVMSLIGLSERCRQIVFASEPPIDPDMVRRAPLTVVASLSFVGLTRWYMVPEAIKNGSTCISSEEWSCRIAGFQSCCQTVLMDYIEACRRDAGSIDRSSLLVITRGIFMMRSMWWCVNGEHASCKDALWSGVGREISLRSLSMLGELCRLAGGDRCDEDDRRAVERCIGGMLGAIGCMLKVFRRQIGIPEGIEIVQEVAKHGLEAAKRSRSSDLALSLFALLQDQLGDGFSKEKEYLVGPAVDLAARSVEGEIDVSIAAVELLGEALTRHWLMFWPGDVACVNGHSAGDMSGIAGGKEWPHAAGSSAVRSSSTLCMSSSSDGRSPPTRDAEEKRCLYMRALGGILTAVGRDEPSVCRAGLVSLEKLDGSRKLYSRDGGFRGLGGGLVVVSSCISALRGSRGSLVFEEASNVVWGVAKADWGEFYGGGGFLERVVCGCGVCTDDEVKELLNRFGGAYDRPSFVRALAGLVNDLKYFESLRQEPVAL